jgi:sRNA-binding regulator protein Hfq
MSSSTLYTIGTALSRAEDGGIPVSVLVEGRWLTGQVVGVDGHGVILAADGAEHSVIRIQSISAVRVLTSAPGRQPNPPALDHPIPAPRSPYTSTIPTGTSPLAQSAQPS